ncbi:MAG: serine O-acetyltransferase EpsC [Christensenellales bacterium]
MSKTLNEWLGGNKVAAALAKINKESLSENEMPGFTTRAQVIDILKQLRSLVLPGIFESEPICGKRLEAVISDKLSAAAEALFSLIVRIQKHASANCPQSESFAEQTTVNILEGLIKIRHLLGADITAAYEGDPAAKSIEEIILSYPSLEAISIYRIAHHIHNCKVPIIPRIMTEYAHRTTGIDIHPGASIGRSFFIDHGTGVVIGETCTIGNNVKLYQGVTLGAKSFPLDENGNPIKGIKRHPDIEDNVIIYSGATILGGDTRIGRDCVIGGNVWLTQSVPPCSTVFNAQPLPVIKPIDA